MLGPLRMPHQCEADRREIDGTRRYRQKRRTTGNDDDDDDERLLCCLTDGCDVPFVCAVCLILSAMAAWIALVLGGIFAGLMFIKIRRRRCT